MRSDLPGQLDLPDTAADNAGLVKLMASAPLRAPKPQQPCDIGLWSDDARQIDLLDLTARTKL
jgi:hypothetical protein